MSQAPPELFALQADPNGVVAEAYRSLRVSISKHLASGKRVFTMVSAWPGDGKSMVCANLAAGLAQLHQKVLLIDGDLRRPTLSRVFGATDVKGVSDDLEQPIDNPCLGYKSQYANLHLLPRGRSEKNPADLLVAERLERLFTLLRKEYDCVIIDTSPLSACSDALIWARVSDGATMVVSPKNWDGEVEVRYKQQLIEHDIPIVGVVLNGAAGVGNHGYGYGYGYGGGYGSYGHYGQEGKKKRSSKKGLSWPWQRQDAED